MTNLSFGEEPRSGLHFAIVLALCVIFTSGDVYEDIYEDSKSESEFYFDSESDAKYSSDEWLATSESRISPTKLSYAWFEQRLDHSNESDTQHWLQRYFEYGGYHKPGGPIFLQIDAEGMGLPSPLDLIKKGSMAQYAKEQGAYILAIEHRFYGQSHPTSDLSQRNLHYLNIDQAIDDIASFISWFKENSGFQSSKWVLFGTSYGGSLVKWFSQTYPDMTDISVVSSAPLEVRYEMPEYLDKVAAVINRTSPQCLNDLTEGFNCLENAVHGKPCGVFNQSRSEIVDMFNLCEDLRSDDDFDITGLFFTLFNIFNNIVVNNVPDSRLSVSLEGVCRSLTTSPEDEQRTSPMARLAKVVKEVTQASDLSCVEYSLEKIVNYLRDTSWESPASLNGDRQFEWQRCNQLGWVKGSSTPKVPFGNRISSKFHAEVCKRTFGFTEETMKKAIKEVNDEFQGKRNDNKCGIFVFGDADPWSVLGITSESEIGDCNRLIRIEGAAHAKDKGAIQGQNFDTLSFPPSLKPAQKEIGKLLGTWLKQGHCCEIRPTGGRVIVDRIFYPIPETALPRTDTPPKMSAISHENMKNRSSQAVQSDSALTTEEKHLSYPGNEINLEESKKVETRSQRDPDEVQIQNGVPFKEISKFLKKHEDQFFRPDAENNRYRVRIRKTNDDQTGEHTFSKFGIKIRMVQPSPEVNQLNKTEEWENLPQWSRWTDFETRQTINPNATILRVIRKPSKQRHRTNATKEESNSVILSTNSESEGLQGATRKKQHRHTHPHSSTRGAQQHDESEPLSETAYRPFSDRTHPHPSGGDKSLVVLRLHGKPELISLVNPSSGEKKNSNKVKVKRVRKRLHLKPKENGTVTESRLNSTLPSSMDENKKLGKDQEQYVISPERTLAEFGQSSHEDGPLFISNRKYLRGSIIQEQTGPPQQNGQENDKESDSGLWKKEPQIYALNKNNPLSEATKVQRTPKNTRHNHRHRSSSRRGNQTVSHVSSHASEVKPLAGPDIPQRPEYPYEAEKGDDPQVMNNNEDGRDDGNQEKEEGDVNYGENREKGAEDVFEESQPSEFEKALTGDTVEALNVKNKNETFIPTNRTNRTRTHKQRRRRKHSGKTGGNATLVSGAHGDDVKKVSKVLSESATETTTVLPQKPIDTETTTVLPQKPIDNPIDDFLRSKDLVANNSTTILSQGQLNPPSPTPSDSSNSKNETLPKKPWIVNIPQAFQQQPKRKHKQRTLRQKEYRNRSPIMKLVMMRDSRGKKFPVPAAALDWRHPSHKSPFVDMSVTTGSNKNSLKLTQDDVAWVNFGIP